MKNNLCLFETPFKIQKNGVFLFEISFFVLEIWTFFYYANQISDDVILFATKKWKILHKRYLWKYSGSVFETWHDKCASQKKQNDTLKAVAMAMISAPVSCGQKTKYPHLQPLKRDRRSFLKQAQFPYCPHFHHQIGWGRWFLL